MARTRRAPRDDPANGSTHYADEYPGGFLALLEASRGEIAKVLPEGVSVDRVCRMARTAFMTSADIAACTPSSILASVMKAAELGLEPGGGRKLAWLVPYEDKKTRTYQCTFQISYFGLLELARRSGAFNGIEARTVGKNDRFDLAYTPTPQIYHAPHLNDPGPTIGAYAYATLETGAVVSEWMNRKQLDQVRGGSDSPAWREWFDEQAKKVVLKRFLKRQPQSIQLAEALDHDNRMESLGLEAPGQRQAAAPPGRGAAQLEARLTARPPWPEQAPREAAPAPPQAAPEGRPRQARQQPPAPEGENPRQAPAAAPGQRQAPEGTNPRQAPAAPPAAAPGAQKTPAAAPPGAPAAGGPGRGPGQRPARQTPGKQGPAAPPATPPATPRETPDERLAALAGEEGDDMIGNSPGDR